MIIISLAFSSSMVFPLSSLVIVWKGVSKQLPATTAVMATLYGLGNLECGLGSLKVWSAF